MKNSSSRSLESKGVSKSGLIPKPPVAACPPGQTFAIYDMVNKYAADMIAQKYKKAVMKVITILSVCCTVSILESICSIRFGFWLNNRIHPGG
jgi:hypothetical protein